MRMSPSGIELLKRFEGLELEAYQDIAGIWTIGYGHTGDDVRPGMRITEREAEALLRRDLRPREDAVDRHVTVPLNQNEFDALVSFVYNVGIEGFRRSTALRRLNNGDRVGAADALTWWNKATVGGVLRAVTGLTRRRAAEAALFLTPTEPVQVAETERIEENSRVTPIEDSPRRDNPLESRTVQGATIAGGAGVASSTMGRDNVEELDQLERNIEQGIGMTEGPDQHEGSAVPPSAIREGGADDPDDQPETPPEDITEPTAPETGNGMPSGEEETEDTETPDAETSDDDDISITDSIPDAGTMVEVEGMPSRHEVHAVEAQIQFALMILIIIAVLFIIYARVDDWFNYRR